MGGDRDSLPRAASAVGYGGVGRNARVIALAGSSNEQEESVKYFISKF
jgi:hypothetical protein